MTETARVAPSASLGGSFAAALALKDFDQCYIGERDGRIGWMRTVCSGYRPVEGE